jgi:YggT family protein
MAMVLLYVLQLASVILIARALLSWFHPRPGSALDEAKRRIIRITDPVLAPIRRILPRPAGVDLSILAVLMGINLVLMPMVATL